MTSLPKVVESYQLDNVIPHRSIVLAQFSFNTEQISKNHRDTCYVFPQNWPLLIHHMILRIGIITVDQIWLFLIPNKLRTKSDTLP